MVIPLLINGITSYSTRQKPTRSEYEDGELPIIYFSVEAPDWDPSYQEYAQRKEATMELSSAMVNEDTT